MIKQLFMLPVLLLALSMLLMACGEGEDDEEMHVDADGFILMVDDEEIYRQFQGTETGGISLKVGDELNVHVVFIDHDSEEISFETVEGEDDHGEEEDDGHDEDEAFGLALSEYDTSIIEIHLPEADEHEDEEEHRDEGFTFEVIGLGAGQTGIKLELLHGDHPDFTAALPIPVTVSR